MHSRLVTPHQFDEHIHCVYSVRCTPLVRVVYEYIIENVIIQVLGWLGHRSTINMHVFAVGNRLYYIITDIETNKHFIRCVTYLNVVEM